MAILLTAEAIAVRNSPPKRAGPPWVFHDRYSLMAQRLSGNRNSGFVSLALNNHTTLLDPMRGDGMEYAVGCHVSDRTTQSGL